jgi:hypothetical protein
MSDGILGADRGLEWHRAVGNITGLSATVAEMAAKRMEFLKAIVPAISRVAFLASPGVVKQAISGTEAAGHAVVSPDGGRGRDGSPAPRVTPRSARPARPARP